MTATKLLSDNGVSSGITGYQLTGGNDGTLQLQTTTSGGTATTAVTIDNSQNVGIGTSSPSQKLNVAAAGTAARIEVSNTSDSLRGGYIRDTGSTFEIGTNSGTRPLAFATDSIERGRFDLNGNLSVGVTNATNTPTNGVSMLNASSSTQVGIGHSSGTAGGTGYMLFNYNGGAIGSITQNGTTGVLYNLTSDYRLKNNPEPVTGAKDFVMALQPKKWQWWDGSGEGVGFIAHEFMEVAKYSGNGEKDAVDEDGKPVYQSIQPSSSEVMANLVAFIQEQQVLITSLSERITALETK